MTTFDLEQFTGDLVRYRHPLNRKVIYTKGVRYVAQKCEAYWLIDAIASWIVTKRFKEAVAADYRVGEMHFWTLEVSENQTARLYAKADSPEEPFIVQEISFTDFPLPKMNIWAAWDGEHWTLYLPGEH